MFYSFLSQYSTLYSLRVCQCSYDPSLIKAWESWDEEYGSENDHPKEFPEQQVSSGLFNWFLICLKFVLIFFYLNKTLIISNINKIILEGISHGF